MPAGQTLPKLRPRPEVRFGEPLDFSRYYGMAHDRVVLRAVTDEIMYAIMKLSGQEYVDRYAADVKDGAGAPAEDPAGDLASAEEQGAGQASNTSKG
jgi:1-acyl-sn-glycerol-3-phosphate acyltransferase